MRLLLPEITKAPRSSGRRTRASRAWQDVGIVAAGLSRANAAVRPGRTLRSLLLSTAAVLITMAPGLPTPARAQVLGGSGGAGGDGSAGGIGGVGNSTGIGGTGGSGGAGFGGGGGGGPGTVGGPGGAGGTSGGGSGGQGGSHGTVSSTITAGGRSFLGTNGMDGNTGFGTGSGGGGGGGGYGAVVTGGGTSANSGFIGGGNGGSGGVGGEGGGSGRGGNGGVGGIGLLLTQPGTFTNSGATVGGEGGRGGGSSNFFSGGNGGNGGNGINTLGSATINNTAAGTILGGAGTSGFFFGKTPGNGGIGINGGGPLTINNMGTIAGGSGGGENGPGGIGIVGANLTIANAGGTIAGGFSGNGATQAYAIQLTGGTNTVGTGGTITGGINILSGASFQPALNGTTPGTTLAVNGPVTFAPGSFYSVRITPTPLGTDSVTATGGATLTGATVNVLAGQGTYAMRQYTILTAAGLGGTTFAGVTSNFAFLMPTLTYDANNVFLNIQAGTTTAAGTIDYRTAAATQNQRAVAGGLTNAGMQNGGTGAILTAFNQLTIPQAQAAFDSISGEGITGAQNIAFRSTSLFVSSITDQIVFYGAGAPNSVTLTDAPRPLAYVATRTPNSPIVTRDTPLLASRTWRAWATGFGGSENISGQAGIGSAAQTNSIYGGSLGVDYQIASNYLAGVAIGGTDGSFSVGGRNTFGRTTGGHAAFYTLANFGSFYGAGTTSISYFGNQTTRNIAGFGGLTGETDRGNFGSHEFRSRAEFGWHTGVYGATLTPFVALEIAQLRSNGFTEGALTGPGLLALNVQGQTGASVPGYVGARIARPFFLDNGMVFTPTIQAAYLHEFGPQRNLTAGLVNLPGSTFLVDGARASSNAAQVKAGGELTIGPRMAIFVTFDGEFGNANQLFAGKGGLKITF